MLKKYPRRTRRAYSRAAPAPSRVVPKIERSGNPYQRRPFKLGDRTVMVQGAEDLALTWLIERQRVPVARILHHSEGRIKPLRYWIKRTEYEYVPDIMAGKRAIEVINLWSLALQWKEAQHRSICTREQGIDHRVLVPAGDGTIVCLPDHWSSRSFGWIESWFRAQHVPTSVRILSLDPGSSNFAWSIIDADVHGNRVLRATSMIECPVKSLMGDISDGINRFVHEVEDIIDVWNPNALAAERFMTRGNKGATIELINIMIGTLIARFSYDDRRRVKLLPASQWKNEFNRYDDLAAWYASAPPNVVIHQMDAVGIGLYCADYWFNIKSFSTPGVIPRVLKQLKGLK